MIGDAFGGPGTSIEVVTPSDSTDLTGVRAILVLGAGNVAVKTIHGDSNATAVTITSVPAGTLLPLQVTRVMSTNTTATEIFAIR